MLDALIHSRKFWLAVFGVIQTVLFQFVPQFPEAVWQSINVLVLVLIGAIAVEDAAEKRSNTYRVQFPGEAPAESDAKEQ